GMHGSAGEWEQRSKETGLCFFVCNRTGPEAHLNFEGSLSIVAVNGRRIVEYADKQPAILTIDVDTDSWRPQRENFTISF
ncbi:MAG: carbon-nitrogen hydrolase family protein, partial [Negativicutes bacterium]|nr:carbon-nitrogen hydrolase family protein [Negativicutes bacterium]